MTTQIIEVVGLPEGYRAVAYRKPLDADLVFLNGRVVTGKMICQGYEWLIVEKIQPHRIVLEEDINDNRNPSIAQTLKLSSGRIMHIFCPYTVREVKETDNEEPKLSLSVDQCKKFFNGTITDRLKVFQLVEDFIRDK